MPDFNPAKACTGVAKIDAATKRRWNPVTGIGAVVNDESWNAPSKNEPVRVFVVKLL